MYEISTGSAFIAVAITDTVNKKNKMHTEYENNTYGICGNNT